MSSVPEAVTGDWRTRLPFFYGWAIVAGGLVCMALAQSIVFSFSVFYVALLEEYQWSRASSAGVFSLFMIVNGFSAPAAGFLADRFGPGRVVAAGGTLVAIALLASSRLTELWQFYLTYGLVAGMGIGIGGWTANVTMINRWFSARLGVALGIVSSGVGVGILMVVPLTQSLISGPGWRFAYVVLGALVFAGLVPIGLLVLRGRPEDLGLNKDGASSPAPTETKAGKAHGWKGLEVVDREWVDRPWTVGAALRTSRFWLLCAVKFVGNVTVQMIMVHQVAYLVAGGHDPMLVASVVGLVGGLSMGTKILWGWAADVVGREMAYTLGCGVLIGSIGLLVFARQAISVELLYLYALVFAVGYGVSAPLWPLVTSDLFAGSRFGSIYGSIQVFSGMGSALGVWFGGYIFDLTGSYVFAFGVAAGTKAASAAILWLVAPRKVRRVRRH